MFTVAYRARRPGRRLVCQCTARLLIICEVRALWVLWGLQMGARGVEASPGGVKAGSIWTAILHRCGDWQKRRA